MPGGWELRRGAPGGSDAADRARDDEPAVALVLDRQGRLTLPDRPPRPGDRAGAGADSGAGWPAVLAVRSLGAGRVGLAPAPGVAR
ncbi:MAG TPA: hypothetical protein VFS29_04915 [Motilibacteraceae bacterium]|nr:hypothetical protein [Motilibacteraceae bacterium]